MNDLMTPTDVRDRLDRLLASTLSGMRRKWRRSGWERSCDDYGQSNPDI